MELKDKVVIITGGTRGLGKALALSFLKSGAEVVVCSRNEEDLKDLEGEIIGKKADVTKEDELQKLLEFTIEKFSKLDIWINNAGIWLPHSLVESFMDPNFVADKIIENLKKDKPDEELIIKR